MELVSVDAIEAAADRIAGVAVRTPLLPCPWADPDRPLWLKPENLQPIGAFKIRGAFNAIARLDDARRGRGVVAYSSGNHAQAVAYAAKVFGIEAWIVVPVDTPSVKVEATRAHGAEVILSAVGEREVVAAEVVQRTGATLIPPFDHVDVIAGQGTIGLEIVADLAADLVLVPVSGGGLISGVAVAIKAKSPSTQVWAVEPELAADTAASLAAGELTPWSVADRNRTIADGLRSQPSALTFAHQRSLVDGIVTVGEDEIRQAVTTIARNARLIAEPSGAVATAAYLFHGDELPRGKTVAVISGGNMDPELARELLV
ncbi:Threonine dehydratase, catabolic [Actinokineospora spheciospongiae]|uniref:Threonine dehydratase, catabolic n=1 Tax=Actinokineospora spheciospongiae TaxID=909613 RepID=W7IV44_9PSEU|nr:threonine/serine dehydratase [Actinokineospora spheciospongiae]EWC60607.1 Threonine dehydratase, catabolic [Actinokineospora spheciospongiae]PWW65794.1 threonine dehydratase [Actinokineospora spheciospongiae]